MTTHRERVAAFLSDGKVRRRRDILAATGASRSCFAHMIEAGEIEKVGAGCRLRDAPERLADRSLAEIAVSLGGRDVDHPRGVLCLWSAARLHEMTDMTAEATGEVVAVPRGTNFRPARQAESNYRVLTWARPRTFDTGLEWRVFNGVGIHVTDPARTIVDMFSPRVDRIVPRDEALKCLGYLVARDGESAASRVIQIANVIGVASQGFDEAVKAAMETSQWRGMTMIR